MLRNKLGPIFNIKNVEFQKQKQKHLDQSLFQEGQTLDQL